jgi:hypothetical protein
MTTVDNPTFLDRNISDGDREKIVKLPCDENGFVLFSDVEKLYNPVLKGKNKWKTYASRVPFCEEYRLICNYQNELQSYVEKRKKELNIRLKYLNGMYEELKNEGFIELEKPEYYGKKLSKDYDKIRKKYGSNKDVDHKKLSYQSSMEYEIVVALFHYCKDNIWRDVWNKPHHDLIEDMENKYKKIKKLLHELKFSQKDFQQNFISGFLYK